MIAASILEYMFITVTCCEEIAKKLFEHGTEVRGRAYFWRLRTHYCRANSRTFQNLALRFPGLYTTKLIFRDFPSPENFTNKFPGLRRAKLIFQDFPGPGNFTDTIPLSSRTFQDTWEPCVYTSPWRRRPNCCDDCVCLYMYAAAEPGICIRWTVPSPLPSSISHLFPFPLEVGSTSNQLGGLGERCKLPKRDPRRSLAKNEFGALQRCEKAAVGNHSEYSRVHGLQLSLTRSSVTASVRRPRGRGGVRSRLGPFSKSPSKSSKSATGTCMHVRPRAV